MTRWRPYVLGLLGLAAITFPFLWLTLALLLTALVIISGIMLHPHKPAPLRVTFLDVGQGDGCVIETPSGKVVIVDGGGHPGTDERDGTDPGSRVVVPYLRSRGIGTVDLIVPTHPDDDHVQGLNAVVERCHVLAALDGGYRGTSAPYTRLIDRLHRHSIPIFIARRGQVLDLGGGARLEVLNPPDHPVLGAHSPTNDNSIVLRLVYGRSRFLLTGDAESEAEDEMLTHCPDRLPSDVLKVGHHGSRWSTNPPFLDAVHPSVAIVSCGAHNVYNHPHVELMDRLAARNIATFRTDKQGAITVETDGASLHVTPTIRP